jgi:hypothetical protein
MTPKKALESPERSTNSVVTPLGKSIWYIVSSLNAGFEPEDVSALVVVRPYRTPSLVKVKLLKGRSLEVSISVSTLLYISTVLK